MSERPVVIVGAGLAGLACALDLQRRGISACVLEAAERPGGCLWTDEVEGFRLDRGFQVFLEGYPEARARLDYGALGLQRFVPGARVFSRGRLRTLADPLRRPGDALRSLLSGIATPADALRVLRLRARLRGRSLEQILTAPQESTHDRLRALGFSARAVDEFLRPFFAGVFLDPALATSSRAFEFTFRTFSSGAISLPSRGIQAVPEQLAARLAPGTLRCETPVAQLASGGNVELASGRELAARAVVIATHKPEALRLLGSAPSRAGRSATTLWWAASTPPARGPYLMLDGDGAGPVNHVCVGSEIAPSLAPPGAALVCATAIGASAESDASLDARSRAQLRDWFGARVEAWRLLRVQRIRDTLPAQEPARFEPVTRSVEAGPGRFVCGGHRETASIGGALRSGRRAAHAVAASFAP